MRLWCDSPTEVQAKPSMLLNPKYAPDSQLSEECPTFAYFMYNVSFNLFKLTKKGIKDIKVNTDCHISLTVRLVIDFRSTVFLENIIWTSCNESS